MKPFKKNLVLPFKALRYKFEEEKEPGKLLCLPYDVIDEEKQNFYYNQSPYNAIRLVLGKIYPDDNSENNRYTRAKRFLYEWKSKGKLILDKKPGFYIYEQHYTHPVSGEKKVIQGFIGLIKLKDYKEKTILPHEDVLEKPLSDRFNLTVATNTQFSAIYGLYSDKKNKIDTIISNFIKKSQPILEYYETKNLIHHLWILEEPKLIKRIQKNINKKIIYIADGHHRYQTMLNYKKYFREKYNVPDEITLPVDFAMMFFVNIHHQGLTVLPTHRLIFNLPEMRRKSLLADIKKFFKLKVYNFTEENELEVRKEWIRDLTHPTRSTHTFGVYIKNLKRYFLLTLTNKDAYLKMAKVKKSKTWKTLDVSIIHILLIDHIMHIHKKDITNLTAIHYTKDINDAIQKVKNDKYQVAIILNPATVKEVIKIAKNGEKMPQKSTYFYPKILTGLCFYEMTLSSLF